jgi:hypothetical protein
MTIPHLLLAVLFVPVGHAGDVMPIIDEHVIAAGETQLVAPGERLEFTELRVDGELIVAGEIYGQTLFVSHHGRLELLPGAVVTIADVPIDTARDPQQIGNGILIAGELDINGTEKTAFTQLSQDVVQGDLTLVFASVPLDWQVGDTLAIADTRQLQRSDLGYDFNVNSIDPRYILRPIRGYQHETLEIANIEGNSITLAEPVRFNHIGLHGNFPHAANLTRDVVLKSENPLGTRGHLIGFHGATMSIVGAQIDGFGRTSVDILDSGIVNGDSVVHAGRNQNGRYPIHLHHLGTSGGSEVRGTAINGSPKWGIAIHGTHYIGIDNNAVWQAAGAGIVTEDGNETGLIITRNYTGASNGSGDDIDGRKSTTSEFGFEGAGIWLHAASDTIVLGNVSEGNATSQYAVFQFPGGSDRFKQLKIPKFVGADMGNAQHYTMTTQDKLNSLVAFQEFSGNIAAGGKKGFDFWSLDKPNTFENLTSWNTSSLAFGYFYGPHAPIIVDSTFLADHSKTDYSVGFSHKGEIERGDFDFTRVTVSGFSVGAVLRPTGMTPRSQIVDSIFSGNDLDLLILNGDGARDSETEIANTELESVRLSWEARNLWEFKRGDHMQKTTINGLHAYFDQQEPDFVVPNNAMFGSPGEGVTNNDLVFAGKFPTLGRPTPSDAYAVEWLAGGKVSPTDSHEHLIGLLNYQSFARLKPADLQFLMPEQIATIPSSAWLATIPAQTRGLLSPEQLANLTFVDGLLPLLTASQIASLGDAQIALTPLKDLHLLPSTQITKVPPARFAAIRSLSEWTGIPQQVRNSLSEQQIQAVPLMFGMLGTISVTQRAWLTPTQIQSISYREFGLLASTQLQHITTNQVAGIPDSWQLSQIPSSVRNAFARHQVEGLRAHVRGMIRHIAPHQREWLTDTQVRSLHYTDFQYLPTQRALVLTHAQFMSIPDLYWWNTSFNTTTRDALRANGVQWLNGKVVING